MNPQSAATLWQLLEAAPSGRSAIIAPDSEVRLTYGALREQVRRLADRFTGAGINRADRIAIALANGIPAVVTLLAAAVAATAAPLNPGYRQEEFDFYLEDTGARLLVLPASGMEPARRAAAARGIPVVSAELDSRAEVRISIAAGSRSAVAPAPEQVALILHTSGSTGRPKRVPLTHFNLACSAGTVADTYRLGAEDVSLCVMPLFHVHGLVASMLAALARAGTVVVPERFNALGFWRLAREQRVTWYTAVPTIHQLLLARAGRSRERPGGAEKLRFIRSCSAPLAPEHARSLEEAFGAPVLQAYGMTEASHQIASNPLAPAERKPATVGLATGVEVGIMDAAGRHLARGERGEVVIRGPAVIRGYENSPEANAASFIDGWFRTGDEGALDGAGYLKLTGRLKEMINRGGEKVAPLEIDELLLSHPAVAEAVCFGFAHDTWGEEVAAAVVLREPASEQELLAFCRERIAEFKCPKKIHVVAAIARTATGKIQRRALAATLAPAPHPKSR